MSRQEASLFFRLVSYRYRRGSILITNNKGLSSETLIAFRTESRNGLERMFSVGMD